MHGQLLTTIFILLFASILFVPFSKKIGLSSVLGYLVAGIIIGPGALNLVHDVDSIAKLSEFGVVLFMFLIGLELRPSVLSEMRKDIIRFGCSQVLLTTIIFFFMTWITSKDMNFSIILGMSLALSSTALGIQVLQEKNLLKSEGGKASLAVLLFQDMAIIPMMLAVSLMAQKKNNEIISEFNFLPIVKIFIALFFTIFVGKYVLKYVFRYIATTRLREIFTSVSLLVVIGIAMLMDSVGLSMAFGSFISGLLMADSEFRYELEVNIEPFKGLLMGLFFMSVGMSMDLGLFLQKPWDIIGLAFAITFVKCCILYLLSTFFSLNLYQRLVFTFATSQIGEFAFVLLTLGVSVGVLPPHLQNLFGLVIALSMAITPLLFVFFEKLKERNFFSTTESEEGLSVDDHENPVIIAGFGRFGTIVARILHANNIGTTVLDHDPRQIEMVRKFGIKAYYGDVTRLELLEAAGAAKAKTLIVTIDDTTKAEEIISKVKLHFPTLQILVRCNSRHDYFIFRSLGVNTIIRETFGSALEMGEEILKVMGYGAFESKRIVALFRKHDESYLEESFYLHRNQDALVGLAKKSRKDLERTLENDERWMNNQRYWE